MADLQLTALLSEIEAHEDHKSEWDDPIAWLKRYLALTSRYIHLRLPLTPTVTNTVKPIGKNLNGTCRPR